MNISGNTDTGATNLYYASAGTGEVDYWRVIGAVRLGTNDQIASKTVQTGKWVHYLTPKDVAATTAAAFTRLDISEAVPAIVEEAHLSVQNSAAGSVRLRHSKSTVDINQGNVDTDSTSLIYNAGTYPIFNQAIDYERTGGTVTIYVNSYSLNIR
jgi:hypothetical protein